MNDILMIEEYGVDDVNTSKNMNSEKSNMRLHGGRQKHLYTKYRKNKHNKVVKINTKEFATAFPW